MCIYAYHEGHLAVVVILYNYNLTPRWLGRPAMREAWEAAKQLIVRANGLLGAHMAHSDDNRQGTHMAHSDDNRQAGTSGCSRSRPQPYDSDLDGLDAIVCVCAQYRRAHPSPVFLLRQQEWAMLPSWRRCQPQPALCPVLCPLYGPATWHAGEQQPCAGGNTPRAAGEARNGRECTHSCRRE